MGRNPIAGAEGDARAAGTRQPEEHASRTGYIAALTIGAVASLACFGCGIPLAVRSGAVPLYPLPARLFPVWTEVIAFVVNAVLTQCFEGLAFIHSLSLRWALVEEDRLRFNTNLRLFNSSKRPGPNAWYSNAVSALGMVLAYTATSQLFISGVNTDDNYDPYEYFAADDRPYLNCLALFVLGVVILIQTALGLWCLLSNQPSIRYWTSNALNTTLLALNKGEAAHHGGRCMIPVDSRVFATSSAVPTRPLRQQPSMRTARPATTWVVILLWFLFALAAMWFLIIVFVSRNLEVSSNRPWKFQPSWDDRGSNVVGFSLSGPDSTGLYKQLTAQMALGLLFVVGLQGLQTLGLHSAELVVITARDEDDWRRLAKRHRGRHNAIKPSPFLSALRSWKNFVLVVFKSLLHWLLGQAVVWTFDYCGKACNTHDKGSYGYYSFSMLYARLLIYTLCAALLAAFVTFLAFRQPPGPQPAAWGHIQTLANLVDDWATDEADRFWWGDKGELAGVRHAGLSCRRADLDDIKMDAFYS